jgi:hypothetical protein
MNKPSLAVEPSLQEQPMPVRVPPKELSRALEDDDRCGADTLASGCRCEIPYQPVDEAADLAMKPAVVAEEHAEHLGDGEDELAVGQPQQELLVHVLAQQEGPLL